MVIVILEDDERRAAEMTRLLAEFTPQNEAILFDNSPDMIAWLKEHLPSVALVCLDHDLGACQIRDGERFEPGSGRAVADILAQRPASCPVIIHTTNYHAGPGMIAVLETMGWSVDRVVPFDHLAWLQRAWLPVVLQRLESVRPPNDVDAVH